MESKHKFSMEQRRDCKVTGVVEVHSFDENNILMETVDGMLTIKGSSLHVGRLDLEKGEADVDERQGAGTGRWIPSHTLTRIHWRKKEKGCLHACLADE